MGRFLKDLWSDLKKTRWNKVKPTMKIFGITMIIIIVASTFVFLVSWGITASLEAMKGE